MISTGREKSNGRAKKTPSYILKPKKYLCLLVTLIIAWQFVLFSTLLRQSRNREFVRAAPQQQVLTHKEVDGVWDGMKILCFMTTHVSKQHVDALENCWPKALESVPMLRNSDLLIYANSEDEKLTEEVLGEDSHLMKNVLSKFRSVRIEVPSEMDMEEAATYHPPKQGMDLGGWKKTLGAELSVHFGFRKGWFDEYDWVYRVNPDVVIRDDKFFEKAFTNSSTDGVFIECTFNWIHTDFFAIRPHVMPPNSFQINDEYGCAERQAREEFKFILDSGRFQWLEGARPKKYGFCRVCGDNSPVIHDHEYVDLRCPNIHDHDEYYIEY